MHRLLSLSLCLAFLFPPVQAVSMPKYVALTFDDGPSGRYTQRLLEGLEQREVKATFFLCGYRMAENPEQTEEIWDSGHEIGIHGYTHQSMQSMSRRKIASEITDTRALLPTGCKVKWLRPPGGLVSDGVRQVARAKNLGILSWSVDPRDWEVQDASTVGRRVLTSVTDGDVVLLHDMSDSSVDAALAIVDALQARGFRFVTVSELSWIRRVSISPGQTYRKFPMEEQK